MTKRRALMRCSPATTVRLSTKRAAARTTRTPRPVNRSTESLGAIAAITSRMWWCTARMSTRGSTGAMPKAPAVRMAWARLAAAISALEGTQP